MEGGISVICYIHVTGHFTCTLSEDTESRQYCLNVSQLMEKQQYRKNIPLS